MTAVKGILLGLGLALLILILATTNWIVGILATISISCITVSVVGVIPMVGWKLGVLESLNLTLVVGLAVDYVVHLADGYVIARHQDRQSRTRDMLGHVGISIVSGAFTTLGASVFMLAAKILFFFQFGIFMLSTIGFSLLYALGFHSLLMCLAGPQGSTGSIVPVYVFLKDKIRGKQDTDMVCTKCDGKGFHENPVFDD